MTNVYIITSGEYSEYSIDSVFLDEKEATITCERLNRGLRYGNFCVETHEVASREKETRVLVWQAVYNTGLHGYTVNDSNIVLEEALVSSYQSSGSRLRNVSFELGNQRIVAYAETQEAAKKLVYDQAYLLNAARNILDK